MMDAPVRYPDVETCVEATLTRVGKSITLGIPLGLGKPNQLVNELYRRACGDASLRLRILTALSLQRPTWSNELERRLVQPLSERTFADYPDLAYAAALKRDALPENIEVEEFFFAPGSLLGNAAAQQRYVSSNYTHIARDSIARGVNVAAQLVCARQVDGETRFSLSCNPDTALDLAPLLREQRRAGKQVAVLAQINENLPYMFGEAEVPATFFDAVVDNPAYSFRLFGTPSTPVSLTDYMTGLYAHQGRRHAAAGHRLAHRRRGVLHPRAARAECDVS